MIKLFMKPLGVVTFLLLILSNTSFAQTADVRGFLYDKGNGEPMIFTNVYLKGTTYGSPTDVNGYYNISKLPPGSYTLMSTTLGYDTIQIPITLKAGQILTQKLTLNKKSVNLKTLEISAEKQEQMTQARVSVTKVTPQDIKRIPSTGGEPDIAQYLQVLPGVVFTGDQGGQLYIRGGSPVQNKVLLDGMVIYNPFHSIGFNSVFDTDILRNMDVYTGGFSANYGGRVSSIMDITTKDGNKNRISGKVNVTTFGAKLILEGPLKKAKNDNDGTISYILSGKTSYLDKSSKVLYNYGFDDSKKQPLNLAKDTTNRGLPFAYNDLYGKISFNSANGSKLNLFGFDFTDKVKYPDENINWKTLGAGSNFVLIPQNSAVLIKGNASYSQYGIEDSTLSTGKRSSSINGFNMGLNFTYGAGDNELVYGVEGLGFKTDLQFKNSLGRSITQQDNTTEAAAFIKYRINKGKFVLDPSFRIHYYASLNNLSPEPRFAFKFNATKKFRIKGATGIYSQNLISASSDRDVVNLFYGFVSGPDNLQPTFTDQDGKVRDIKHHLQKARHYIFGFEWDLPKHIAVNLEGYIKQFTQLTNINRDKIFEDEAYNADKPDALKKDFIIETGHAEGVDLSFKYDYKRLYIWVAYSLSRVQRWNGTQEYYPVFDRRHNLNTLASYTFGKNLDWQIDGRWNFGSGFPFVPTQGFFENQTFTGGLNSSYTNSNGALGIQYAPLNEQKRLPYYHRFDFSVKKFWEFGDHTRLESTFSITNMYNRENIFYFDRVKYKRVNQLPILPSLGLSLSF